MVEESPQHVYQSSSPIASPSVSPSVSPTPKRAPPAKKPTAQPKQPKQPAPPLPSSVSKPKAATKTKEAPSKLESVKKRRKVEVEEENGEEDDDDDEEDIGDESFRYDPLDEEDSDEDDTEDDSTSLAPTPVSELKHPYGRMKGAPSSSSGSSQRDSAEDDEEPTNETSRPKRNRIKPLAYWNGEKAEYKIDRRASGQFLYWFIALACFCFCFLFFTEDSFYYSIGSLQLPTIKNVIRNSPSRLERNTRNVPKTATQSMASKGFKGMQQVPKMLVLNAKTKEEEEIALMGTANTTDLKEVNPENFLLSKDLIAPEFTTGFLVIPKGVTKSSKQAKSSMVCVFLLLCLLKHLEISLSL